MNGLGGAGGVGVGGTAVGANSKPTPLLIRILMIGDSSVGKTSLVLRYDNRGFNLRFTTTIGVDYSDRLLELEGRQVKLQVPDSTSVIIVPNSVGQSLLLESVVCSKMSARGRHFRICINGGCWLCQATGTGQGDGDMFSCKESGTSVRFLGFLLLPVDRMPSDLYFPCSLTRFLGPSK